VAARDDAGRAVVLRPRTLGCCILDAGGVAVTPSAGTMFSLLVRVVHAPAMAVPRELLLDALWPGLSPARQGANLRQVLYRIRQLGLRVELAASEVVIDPDQVVRTFAIERTVERYVEDVERGREPFGAFLPGFTPPHDDLVEWVEAERGRVHAEVRRVLIGEMRARKGRAEWAGAEGLARAVLQLDPLNEDAVHVLAECLWLAGARAEALGLLDRYVADLGPGAGELRLPTLKLRRRMTEPPSRPPLSFAPTERHFLGREAELAELTLEMRRARWHDGGAVLLHGPPGIGKTRLTVELGKVAVLEGITELRTTCREGDESRPLALFLDVIPELLALPGALGCTPEAMHHLRRLVPEERMPAASAKLAAEGAAAAGDAPMYPGALRRAILDLVAAVTTEKPVLLVVDDAHWIDAPSWDVLADLVERTDALRLFVVLASREAHARPVRPERTPRRLAVRAVPPLADGAAHALARAIGDDLGAPVDDALADWLVRASEGVPLYLRSLVTHWIETGEAGGVPPTLAAVIEQRLDRLSVEALTVAAAASMLESHATFHRLASALELSDVSLVRHLDDLDHAGVLSHREQGRIACHEMARYAVFGRLSRLGTEALTQLCARSLHSDGCANSDPEAVSRAIQLFRKANDPQALAQALLDGAALLSEADAPNWIDAIDGALSGSLSPVTRRQLIQLKGKSELSAGEYRASLATLTGAPLHRPRRNAPSNAEIEERIAIIDSAYRADPLADRDQLVAELVMICQAPSVPWQLRRHAAEVGLVITSNTGDIKVADLLYELAGPADYGATDFVELIYHTIFGDKRRAREIALQIRSASEGAEASLGEYNRQARAGFSLRLCGSTEEAISCFERAYAVVSRLGLDRLAQYASWQLSQIHLDYGARSEADRWHNQLIKHFATDRDPISSNYAHAHFARMAIEQGDLARGNELVGHAREHLPRMPTTKAAAYQLALELDLSLAEQRSIIDESRLNALLAKHATLQRLGTSDYMSSVLARAFVARHEHARALSLLKEYLELNRREECPPSAHLRATIAALPGL
jgi:DNA-binding SARP family transcriptional activator